MFSELPNHVSPDRALRLAHCGLSQAGHLTAYNWLNTLASVAVTASGRLVKLVRLRSPPNHNAELSRKTLMALDGLFSAQSVSDGHPEDLRSDQ